MKSTILDIYYNDSPLFDTIKLTEEYWRLSEEEEKLKEGFVKSLSKEQEETFNKTYDLVVAQWADCEGVHFKEGFKMGVLLGLELGEDQK